MIGQWLPGQWAGRRCYPGLVVKKVVIVNLFRAGLCPKLPHRFFLVVSLTPTAAALVAKWVAKIRSLGTAVVKPHLPSSRED